MKSKTVQFKWKLDIKKIKNSEFNASKIYKYKDAIWRIGKDSIQPIGKSSCTIQISTHFFFINLWSKHSYMVGKLAVLNTKFIANLREK